MRNPFHDDVVYDPTMYRPEWDVPSLNQHVVEGLKAAIGGVSDGDDRKFRILLGQPGCGKTHLFGRVAYELENDVFCVFVGPLEDPFHAEDQVRRQLVETLFRPGSGGQPCWLERLLARLCRPSFGDYFDWLPSSVAARHEQLGNRLRQDDAAVLEVVHTVRSLPAFLKLAASVGDAFPGLHHDAVRGLALGWSPVRDKARRWLRGESLPEEDLEQLSLGVGAPSLVELIRAVSEFMPERSPIVVCFDNAENILTCDSPEPAGESNPGGATSTFTANLVRLQHELPNICFVISCLEADWPNFRERALKMFRDRCALPEFTLNPLNPDEAVELLRRRLQRLSVDTAKHGELWPFDESSVRRFVEDGFPVPRAFLKVCAREFDAWVEGNRDGLIRLVTDGDGPEDREIPPIEAEFQQLWQAELEQIKADDECTPESVADSFVHRAVVEILKLVHQTMDWTIAGARLVDLTDDALPQGTSTTKRYACKAKIGAQHRSEQILVATTKLDNARQFRFYAEAIVELLDEGLSGVMLIHPEAPIRMGAVTRETLDTLHDEGRLRYFPLVDNLETFYRLVCYLRFHQKATARDLTVGNRQLAPEDYEKLVKSLGLLDRLPLLEQLLSPWTQEETAVEEAATGAAVAESSDGGEEPARAASGMERGVGDDDGGAATVALATSAEQWALELQKLVVRQLEQWRVRVKPAKVQIGPRFARLLVKPQGSTTVNQVRNKAEDLKTRLDDIKTNPLIDAQANGISIDVELPGDYRRVVTLAEMQADAAEGAVFPLGQDVAGKNYWGDFANSVSAHYLVAGTTGSGKSEFLRSMITGLARMLPPEELQFVLIDPKRLTFNFSGTSAYFLCEPVYDAEEALPRLQDCFKETEKRYKQLSKQRVKDLDQWRQKGDGAPPRIVVICDEFPDLVADANFKKELESPLKRLSAKARAAGVHLVLAAQRPEAKVVTPQIRSNLPGRVCLKVASVADSKIVLEQPDAANLLGNGDLLWRSGAGLVRLQGPLVTDEELEDALCIG